MPLGPAAGDRRAVRRLARLTPGLNAKKEPRQTARLWKVYREETPRKGKTLESVENQVSLQRTKIQVPSHAHTITRCYGVGAAPLNPVFRQALNRTRGLAWRWKRRAGEGDFAVAR